MRVRLIAFVFTLSSLSLSSQEKLSLQSDLARQSLAVPIVQFSGTPAPAKGVTDSKEPLTPPLKLLIENVALVPGRNQSSDGKELQYEVRLINSSTMPQEIPINPDRNKVISVCASGHQQEVAMTMSIKSGGHQDQETTSVWSGCRDMKESLKKILPGQWITYRGSITLPSKKSRSAIITGSWSISEVIYSAAPDGNFSENSKGRLSVSSQDRKVDF
jgi:hypothetical protein